MAREGFALTHEAVPAEPEFDIGDLAKELLLPLHDVRVGVSLVLQDAPRASELMNKIDATLQAMERIFDELLDITCARARGHRRSGGRQ
jgi:hypothetical protein